METDKIFNQIASAAFIVEALLEDYAKVISKLEKSKADSVKKRIMKRANEIKKKSLAG